MDGPWQTGHKTALEYAPPRGGDARAMKQVDPSVKLVACGSSSRSMPTFGEWERVVLEECYDDVELISAHAYYEESETTPLADFLASAVDMDLFIESVAATADAVGATKKSAKKIGISFDEWNVWNQTAWNTSERAAGRTAWDVAPRVIEDEYSVTDAVVVGTLLNSLLRHGEPRARGLPGPAGQRHRPPAQRAGRRRLEAADRAALPEMRNRALGATILDVRTTSATYETGRYGTVDLVDVTAVTHDDGRVTAFVANRSLDEAADVDVALGGVRPAGAGEALVLAATDGQDRWATNTADAPTAVRLRPLSGVTVEARSARAPRAVARFQLPPLSWAVVELVPAG